MGLSIVAPTISLILPTVGRKTLSRCLASVAGAGIGPGDELVIVGDGDPPGVMEAVAGAGLPDGVAVVYEPLVPAGGCVGQPARNLGMSVARANWLMFTQDDNLLAPGAFDLVREAVRYDAPAVHLFRVVPRSGVERPMGREIAEGVIDGDCLVVPNDPARLGQWGMRYQGDYDFLASTLAHYPEGSVVWHEDLISVHQVYERRLALVGSGNALDHALTVGG